MAKKKNGIAGAVPAATQENAPAVEAPVAVAPEGFASSDEPTTPINTDVQDSLGKPKDTSVAIGPRGPNVDAQTHQVVPVGLKSEPAKKADITVTDKVDSAGSNIAEENAYVPGPRGPHAKHCLETLNRS